ncbi:hypothetical protein BGZ83_011412, partial [Gryganskiella cystojenkinii]
MSPMSATDDYQARVREKWTKSREFTDASRKVLCTDNAQYSEEYTADIKKARNDVNAKILPAYDSEAKLVAFYDNQYKCYQNCRDSATPGDRKFCIPFQVDPNAEVCEFQRDFRKPTLWEHVTLDFTQLQKDLQKGTYTCRTSTSIT